MANLSMEPALEPRSAFEREPVAARTTKERLTHLQGAFDELSDIHARILVMRELEGMSYREIGQELDLTRPAVESALFRARRRLESEYTELSEGRRCEAMLATMMRMAAGTQRGAEEHRLARHAKRCHACRKRARELGVEPLTTLGALRKKAVALLPIPWLSRRSGGDGGGITGLFSSGANAAPLAERAAALVAAVALVGAGGAALQGGAVREDRATAGEDRHAIEQATPVTRESQRRTAGPATDGERAGARRASGRRASGPAGGRAGDSDRSSETGSSGGSTTPQAPSGGSQSGSSSPSGALPALPGTSTPSIEQSVPRIEAQVPELPTVSPPQDGGALPEVQVPETGVPVVDGTVEGVTNSLPAPLP